MRELLRLLMTLLPIKPILRFVVGLVAVPVFRLILRKGVQYDRLDEELEKDLEQWFRGALLLLVATRNMEQYLFGWVPLDLSGEHAWFGFAMRIMLAIGVTEAMPDQELFRVIHPGPPKLKLPPRGFLWQSCRQQGWAVFKGLVCQHLDRSSQMFAIMAAIFQGRVGWTCYTLAVCQYLIIGLVTSRDKARDVLTQFDRQMQERRQWLEEELEPPPHAAPPSGMQGGDRGDGK